MKIIFTLLLAATISNSSAQHTSPQLNDPNCHPRKPNENINILSCRSEGIIYIIDNCGPCYKPVCIQAIPVIDISCPRKYILTKEEINQLPAGHINDYLSLFPGIYQSRRGDELNVYGGRTSDNLYILDGVILGF